jgi:two-component system response regulator NreC
MCAPIRVLLIDDHQMVREGLCALLNGQADIQIVGQADDGRQGYAMVVETQPDVVIVDIHMPGMNGLDAARKITSEYSQIEVLILSMYSSEEHVYQALRAGVAGFVVKEAAWEELAAAIRAVHAGKTYLSPAICREDIQGYIRRAQAGEVSDSHGRLTPREREVLQLIAEEHTTREIAQLLDISPKTIETHRSHLMAKLGIHTTAGLTRYAISRGIVDLDL